MPSCKVVFILSTAFYNRKTSSNKFTDSSSDDERPRDPENKTYI